MLKIANLDVLDSRVTLQLQEKLILATYVIKARLNFKNAIEAFVCDYANRVIISEEHDSRRNLPYKLLLVQLSAVQIYKFFRN